MTTGSEEFNFFELTLFEGANNWKAYLQNRLNPFLKGRVLEVGAGIGGTTAAIYNNNVKEWVCLEPCPNLFKQLSEKVKSIPKNNSIRPICGVINDLPSAEKFDTILYIDVLEHIKDDHNEIAMAVSRLSQNGHLIILSPAFMFLFSPFDSAVGHFRRYNKDDLRKQANIAGLEECYIHYLDSVGFFASLGNKLLLKNDSPGKMQIHIWDHYMVRLSRWIDRLFGYSFGRSILGVWQLKK
ncbi:MAG: methyltransferase domain-containing protein [Magnetococcales bacterium]|nr:methyltransferase domain-containing protein [Magnetococcales bacterium]